MLGICSVLVGCAAHSPAPVSGLKKDYNSIARGSYRGSYYQVERGDTLYFIAYLTDKDVKEIIRYNDLTPPYTIYPGQKLKLWQPAYTAPAYGGTGAGPVAVTTPPPVVSTPSIPSKNSNQGVIKSSTKTSPNVARKIHQRRLNNLNQRSMLVLTVNKMLTKLLVRQSQRTIKFPSGYGQQKGE